MDFDLMMVLFRMGAVFLLVFVVCGLFLMVLA